MRSLLVAGVLALAGCASSTPGSNVKVENCEAVRSAPSLTPGDWHTMVNKNADDNGQNAAIAWRQFQNYIALHCPELAAAVGR